LLRPVSPLPLPRPLSLSQLRLRPLTLLRPLSLSLFRPLSLSLSLSLLRPLPLLRSQMRLRWCEAGSGTRAGRALHQPPPPDRGHASGLMMTSSEACV
jgi:hypothetical protein